MLLMNVWSKVYHTIQNGFYKEKIQKNSLFLSSQRLTFKLNPIARMAPLIIGNALYYCNILRT
jgi:hypothetical protein